MNKTRTEYFYLTFLKVASAVSVVILHANGSFWNYRNDGQWAVSNAVECVFYFAVPVFFMITGATLLDYPDYYDTRAFFKKRFDKTVIPFLSWSLIYTAYLIIRTPRTFFENELRFDKIFNGIFNTEYYTVFWFFIPLFCIYCSIPLLANVDNNKKVRVYGSTALIALVVNIVVPFIISVINTFFDSNIEWSFSISVFGEYIFFVIIGYLLHKNQLSQKARIAVYAFALLGLMTHIVGTHYVSSQDGEINRLFKGYTNLPCVLYSAGVFVFAKQIFKKTNSVNSSKIVNYISFLNKYSFEFYLMHIMAFIPVRFVLSRILGVDRFSQLYVFLLTALTIPICISITYVLRKIPLIKKIVP